MLYHQTSEASLTPGQVALPVKFVLVLPNDRKHRRAQRALANTEDSERIAHREFSRRIQFRNSKTGHDCGSGTPARLGCTFSFGRCWGQTVLAVTKIEKIKKCAGGWGRPRDLLVPGRTTRASRLVHVLVHTSLNIQRNGSHQVQSPSCRKSCVNSSESQRLTISHRA